MEQFLLDTIEYKNHEIKVYQDEYPMNPIKEWDMLGTFSCFHRNYDLSSKDNVFTNGEDLLEYFKQEKDNVIKLPLRLYDHSGITMSTSKSGNFGYPYNDRWDSGLVGYIHVHKDKIRETFSKKRITKKLIEQVKDALVNEVKEFDMYLTGEVYGFVIEGDLCEDSCWGFFGDAGKKDMIEEAKSNIDYAIKESVKKTY